MGLLVRPTCPSLSKPSTTMGKFLSDTQYEFTLEPYADGTPAPTVVTKEADMALAAPFLLARPDFSKTEVVYVSHGPHQGATVVFGYIEGSFLVSRTGDTREHHVSNIYRCMNT